MTRGRKSETGEAPAAVERGHTRLLRIKLWRDIRRHGWQFVAVIVVVVLGVGMYGASYDSYLNLSASYAKMHEELAFADLTFAGGPWAPELADRLRTVRGVAAVEGRTVVDPPVRVGGDLKLIGRVVGIPGDGQPDVNKLFVLSGRWPSSGGDAWVFVEKHFATDHELDVGSSIEVRRSGGWGRFRVAGVVASPEYIWPARNRQDLVPSSDTFGVLFAPEPAARRIAGAGRRVNEVVVHMRKGADEEAVISQVKSVLGADEIDTITPKREQASNESLEQDLEGFEQMAGFFPFLFLSIGAVSIYVMLTRMVHAQRPQVGLLRASGYGTGAVVRHYLAFGVVVAIIGGALGALLGLALGSYYTSFYVTFLSIPVTVIDVYPSTMVTGAAMALVTCLLAAWAPARTAARIHPAEAMRGETPTGGGKRSFLEKVFPPLGRLSALDKIPLRGIGRSPRRSVFTVVGVVLANVLILVSLGMLDSFDYLLQEQFVTKQKYDVQAVFDRPLRADQAVRTARVKGARRVEPAVELPVILKANGKTYSTVLIGLPADTRLRTFLDRQGRPVSVRKGRILVGTALSDVLGIEAGDLVRAEVQGAEGYSFDVRVGGFTDDAMGTFAYGRREDLSPRLAEAFGPRNQAERLAAGLQLPKDAVTSAYLATDDDAIDSVVDELGDKDRVAAAMNAKSLVEYMREFMGLIYAFMGVMLAFGAIMAFALIFNTMSVNILERTREIVTLRTLGVRQRQISYLITAENMLLAALGIVPGLIAGWATAWAAMAQYQTDLFSFSLHMYPRSFIITALVIQLTALVAQWPALRAVHRVDMTKEIKERTG